MRVRTALLAVVVLGLAVGVYAPARPAAALGAGSVRTLAVAGHAGVPASGVGAVVLNLTATEVASASYVTVWPTGAARPLASNVNMEAGDTVANLVLVPLGADGSVSLYQHQGPAEVVVDAVGWFGVAAGVRAVTPARVLDTRSGAVGALGADGRAVVAVAGQGGVPPTGVGAVVVNLTATDATDTTFLTAWPTGTARPDVSNLNPSPGRTAANLAVVPVGADGSITVRNHRGRVQVVVDVLGWVPSGAPGVQLPGADRVLDTRTTGRPVGVEGTVSVPVPGAAVAATGLLVNVTMVNATAATFLAVPGTGTSVVNTVAGRTAANLAVLPVGTGGAVTLVNHAGSVDVVVDVLGWFGAGSGFGALTPTRLLDTRVAHAFPLPAGVAVGYARDHHDYPATDLIVACGVPALSPVTGVVTHVRRDDRYDPRTDNPALRGGRSVSILGDDGVRYYGSHYQSVEPGIEPGVRVVAGQRIATVGQSGDAVRSVCHIHFGLSPACSQPEWEVRRGVIWPWPYLDSWRAGGSRSPGPEIEAWAAAHPSACAQAAAGPFAADAG